MRWLIQDKLTAAQIAAINNAVSNDSIIQVSATYSVLSTDGIIECTSGTFTVSLPTAIGIEGKRYTIKNSGSGVITINPNGSETIDGNLTITLNQYESRTIVSNDTNWIII